MAKLTILTNFLVNLVNFAKFAMSFLHGDLDVFGDIVNIATFASAFFHSFLDHFGCLSALSYTEIGLLIKHIKSVKF